MRRSLLPAVLSLSLLLSTLATAHAAQNASSGREIFTSFDVPGAIHTVPTAINPAGVVVGSYAGAGGGGHGFVWYPDGTIVSFDAPVASPMGPPLPSDINPAGQIVGIFRDRDRVFQGIGGLYRGFVRNADGTIAVFDVPGAVETFASDINPAGQIVGFYSDAAFVNRGFVRSPH